jgi:hypothetical protein
VLSAEDVQPKFRHISSSAMLGFAAARRSISASRSRMTFTRVALRSTDPLVRRVGITAKPGQLPDTSTIRPFSTAKPASRSPPLNSPAVICDLLDETTHGATPSLSFHCVHIVRARGYRCSIAGRLTLGAMQHQGGRQGRPWPTDRGSAFLWRKRRLRLAEGAAFHRGLGSAIDNQQSIKRPAA